MKQMKGFGGSVFEIKADDEGGTYRAAVVAKFKNAIYVLHAFQKKSRKGIETDRTDIEIIKRRLKQAEDDAKGREKKANENRR